MPQMGCLVRKKKVQDGASINSDTLWETLKTAQMFVSEIFHGERTAERARTQILAWKVHCSIIWRRELERRRSLKLCWKHLDLVNLTVIACMLPFLYVFVLDVKELTQKLKIEISSNPALYKTALN